MFEVKILFEGFSPLKRLERKARPASWRGTPVLFFKF